MNCKRAKAEIALSVGDDLDATSKQELEQHLVICAHCRNHWMRLQSSLRILRKSDVKSDKLLSDSVWPGVSTKLASRGDASMSQFNGWLAATAVVAACVMILTLPPAQTPIEWETDPQPIVPVQFVTPLEPPSSFGTPTNRLHFDEISVQPLDLLRTVERVDLPKSDHSEDDANGFQVR
jgi:hypothetical protein